jgi:predicted nucleic acid-binding protein
MKPFFIDTSGWCAIYDKSDDNHKAAFPFWTKIAANIGTLYTSDYIIDETLTLLNVRISHTTAVEFGRIILASKVIEIIPVTVSRWEEAWKLFIKYSDKDFSFTDCTSFIIMHELNLKEALTFDRHFQQMGFINVP